VTRTPSLLLTLVVALPGCSSRAEPPSRRIRTDLPEWRFSAEPTLSIGVVEGDPHYQFFRAQSAVRLPDGTIVVANTGTGHLRYYDAHGRYLARAGGRGEGPGEFRELSTVYVVGPDSVMAYDHALRESYFDGAGNFLGSVNLPRPAADEFPFDNWLYRRNWVEGVPDDERRVALAATLDRLPFPSEDPGYWYIRVDQAGNLWISDGVAATGERTNWTIRDPQGREIARASVPPRFEMLEITARDVLGRWWDEWDVEHIRIYELEKPETSPTVVEPPPVRAQDVTLPEGDVSLIIRDMQSILRNTVTAQEAYYADHFTYALDRSELDVELPEGITFDFIKAERAGWLGVALHVDVPVMCGMGINVVTPPGWFEGVPKCSQVSMVRREK
jgi:hypothetical protein